MTKKEPIWILRDLSKCSGCRKCEVVCSLSHENRIWPEASRIRVFMLVPGIEFPHLCVQCEDYPCVQVCPVNALSVSKKTGAVLVRTETCVACGKCIEACPGKVPHVHPGGKYVVICDLCNGKPRCVEVCRRGGWNVLAVVPRVLEIRHQGHNYKLYARLPEQIAHDLIVKIYGQKGEEYL